MTDLNVPLKEWKQPWIREGAARAEARAQEKKDEAECDRQNAAEMDRLGGGMLFRPSSEWERSDREGKMGRRAFFRPGDSSAYRRGWDAIDWRA